jgi:hypothetical protein
VFDDEIAAAINEYRLHADVTISCDMVLAAHGIAPGSRTWKPIKFRRWRTSCVSGKQLMLLLLP